MRQLIFERLSLAWDEVTLPRPPMLAASAEMLCRPPLLSFPTPGRLDPAPPDDVRMTAEGLVFPRFGAYFLLGAFGAAKILLLDPDQGPDERLREIAGFVTGCVWHSANDTYLCYDADSARIFRPRRPLDKLFFSDQPLGLHCGTISSVLACLLIDRGYSCRRASFRSPDGPRHMFLDVFLPQARRWAYVDADFGVMLTREDGFLSSEEVVWLRNAGRDEEITILPIARKHFTDVKRHFPATFSGQLTWRPEFMSPRVVADDPYYRTVVRDGFKVVEYQDIEIVGGSPALAPLAEAPAAESNIGRPMPIDFSA